MGDGYHSRLRWGDLDKPQKKDVILHWQAGVFLSTGLFFSLQLLLRL